MHPPPTTPTPPTPPNIPPTPEPEPKQPTNAEVIVDIAALLTNPNAAMACIGSIGGKRVYFGLDSCAQASIICKSVIDAAPEAFPPIQPCPQPVAARCPNGTTTNAIGEITIPFRLNNHPFVYRFFCHPRLLRPRPHRPGLFPTIRLDEARSRQRLLPLWGKASQLRAPPLRQ